MKRAKEFTVSPFALLKGVTVAPPPPDGGGGSPSPRSDAVPGRDDDGELFRRAMADIEPLSRTPGRSKGPKRAGRGGRKEKPRPVSHDVEAEDVRLFIDALREMKLDVTFVSDGTTSRRARTDRLDALKEGKIAITYELDLHGLTREDAIREIGPFIRSARRHGERAVLVITGRGERSPDGPVLQGAVTSWLSREGRGDVAEFAPAPPEYGGDGALVVFLRRGDAESA